MRRIEGVDVARGVAVLGMVTAHVGPDDHGPLPPGGFSQLADGRSAALFVVLAGVGLALLSGGSRPVDGTRLVQSRLRILVRGALLFALGQALLLLGVPIAIILTSYAVYFALALLALTWPRAALVSAAAAVALVGPVLVQWAQPRMPSLSGGSPETLADVVVGHYYPAAVWMSYVLTGLAIGRCDLRSARLRRLGAALGAGLVVLGHGGSWVAMHALGLSSTLATSAPHSSTTFEVVGNTGVALLVLAVALAAADRWPRALSPLGATGALALTAYTGHLLAIAAIGPWIVWDTSPGTWAWFVGVIVLGCWAWRHWFGRGPLERLLHAASTRAADVAPDTLPDRVPRTDQPDHVDLP
ncbi:heparan-alpha-glucosaminide N-acetyltransferase domain-containing protein [Cellulomonas soli]|uniref:heparan-alpha-glucosaminide N-acetyltransferase domain-containing protein n=1 Tax=Cellulomonas soli TaxID=931535 RepID=UPI003F85754D